MNYHTLRTSNRLANDKHLINVSYYYCYYHYFIHILNVSEKNILIKIKGYHYHYYWFFFFQLHKVGGGSLLEIKMG